MNNPVTNKAVSFWKTVYNWSQYIAEGEFPPKQLVLKYVIVATHKLSVGSIPQSFFDAKDKEQAKQALETAKFLSMHTCSDAKTEKLFSAIRVAKLSVTLSA